MKIGREICVSPLLIACAVYFIQYEEGGKNEKIGNFSASCPLSNVHIYETMNNNRHIIAIMNFVFRTRFHLEHLHIKITIHLINRFSGGCAPCMCGQNERHFFSFDYLVFGEPLLDFLLNEFPIF